MSRLALCLLALLTYVQRVGFASTGTALKHDLGLTGSQWGLVMAAFLVAYARGDCAAADRFLRPRPEWGTKSITSGTPSSS